MSNNRFKCQNCHCPIEVDPSLLDLSLAQREMITNATGELDNNSAYRVPDDRKQLLKQVKTPAEIVMPSVVSPAESYVFLNANEGSAMPTRAVAEEAEDEDDDSSKTLSSNIQNLSNIFNILSSKSNVDYPICQVCCELLIQKLKKEYEEAVKKRNSYSEFVARLEKQKEKEGGSPTSSKDREEAANSSQDSHDKHITAEKEELIAKLVALENENNKLDKEIEELEEKLREREESEVKNVINQNLKDLEQISFIRDAQSLKNQYELTLNNLDKLRRTNIFNETFRISHSGPFGTINGLRLGGFGQVRVPWQEVNAAMGQLILLLATIACKIHHELDCYKLKPLGSYSKVEQFDQREQKWITYNAYRNDEFKLGKFFHKETSLDKALECIIAIVDQIAKKISELSREQNDDMELPYPMSRDKINSISVKLMGSEPTLEWTTACKFLLTNAKWLLAFSSQVT
ncbi:HCL540Cp [Eremothecium sinecaudum]|uniref:HCL540Cp n=1 Tax=Eremothecium sinecaudum TaxID=45286 RepID=A0A109UW25_9SACH|nr:HCL540Cp [Eremothecium sinecaudum]AMD19611.1 HCL540Cp [Eremothecium sinecaudum]